jgi:hypothetical protein
MQKLKQWVNICKICKNAQKMQKYAFLCKYAFWPSLVMTVKVGNVVAQSSHIYAVFTLVYEFISSYVQYIPALPYELASNDYFVRSET